MIIMHHIFVELENGVYNETYIVLNKSDSKHVYFDQKNQAKFKYLRGFKINSGGSFLKN